MASVFELLGDFTVTRLRSRDVSYLRGAVRPVGDAPIPIALARGPQVTGPGSATTGGATWSVGVTIAPNPDVAWVLISGEYNIKRAAGPSIPLQSYLFTFGDITDIDNTRGPILGMGEPLGSSLAGTGGSFAAIDLPVTPRNQQLWVPLDPVVTAGGWTPVISVLLGATPPGVDDFQIDMSQVLLVGYPVNAWNTGALWAGTAFRGS